MINLVIHSGASARERARIYEQLSSSGPSSGPIPDSKPSHVDDCLAGEDGLEDDSSGNRAKMLLKAKKKAEKEAQKAFEEQARLELER